MMKIIELFEDNKAEETVLPMPHLYLDMDGVQADFFTAWANIHNKERYKEIGDKQTREESIASLSNRGHEFIANFFATLPVLDGGMQVVDWLKRNNVPFTILSAPLRDNHAASIEGKKLWLDQYNPGTSESAIFTGTKEHFATKGQPNVLVDDHKKYLERWQARGGIPVLHRNGADTIEQLENIYQPYLTK